MVPHPKYKAPLYRGSDKLLDKVAMMTGGDSGIGRVVAVLYAREGADIVVVFLPAEKTCSIEGRLRRLVIQHELIADFNLAGTVCRFVLPLMGSLRQSIHQHGIAAEFFDFDDIAV